ncbi:hypothetical protein K2X33_03300 [bacterium]|nr:hypothetical protein [bacterium]
MIRFFLAALLLAGCSGGSVGSVPQMLGQVSPKLFLQQAAIFDMVCQAKTAFKIEPSWQQELFEKLPKFQSAWDGKAAGLIAASQEMAGREFSRREFSVALTLCSWTPMGDPAFIVSARPYLQGPAQADPKIGSPMGLVAFVSMTHHELLHSLVDNLVDERFFAGSALLQKYKDEPTNVQVHLHLMAIQKAAYVKLGDEELIRNTDQLYAFIGGDYATAWGIVGQEGTEKFLQEAQAFNRKPL